MNYIPSRDIDLDAWAANFSTLITAAPATYGLTAGDATAISDVVDPWHTAFLIATNPLTRTTATIADKDSKKGAMVPILRLYAQQVKANVGVSDMEKVALGIHINDPGPTPVPVPTSIPKLSMNAAFHLNQTLDIRATETPTSRAKPAGSIACLTFATFSNVGDAAPTDPEAALFRKLQTRNLGPYEFLAPQVGKRVTWWGRWVNRKGEVGPWSLPLSQVVA